MDSFIPPSPQKPSVQNKLFMKLHSLRASDGFFIKVGILVTFIFFITLLTQVSMRYTVPIPSFGGTLKEGVVGTPRFVNPVLAVTRADKDLSALVYDGLMRLGPEGTIIPNIAESVTVSDDGLTYNIILRQNVFFHDDVPLTAADVAFTVLRMQDAQLGSPLRANFADVTIEEIGEFELNFVLQEAYAPFIENLTFGILPEHIWKDAGIEEFPFSEWNSRPIGSGPYKVKDITRTASGIPKMYTLEANTHYHLSSPKIETIELHFFGTEEKLAGAFVDGVIESVAGISVASLPTLNLSEEAHHLERIPLPRTFGIFINSNKSKALRDSSARHALDVAIDREELVQLVMGGYGNPLYSPLPIGFGPTVAPSPSTELSRADHARTILREGGWKLNQETQEWEKKIDDTIVPLTFSISTANGEMFTTTTEFLKNAWSAVGINVTIKQFEQSDLTQTVIRPRDYETLLFGTQLGRALDVYSFWHSSQRNDPGLNIALYANITTDSILSEMRRATDTGMRDEALMKFVTEIQKEIPALFLYAPELLYVFPNRIAGATFIGMSEPSEHWSNVHEWYIETESTWPFFNKP